VDSHSSGHILAALFSESREDAAEGGEMAQTASFTRTAADATAVRAAEFDFQRFDVYRVALEFQALVPGLLPRRGYAALRDQLDRASASILLNIAGDAHDLLIRVTQMLTKLVLRMRG
jgi:hypothetical protein